MGCLKLTYQNNTELKTNRFRKELTLNKSDLKERSTYLYGYQGSESDDEMYNQEGTSYTTHFRGLDVRIGRWISVDPKGNLKPWQTPYNSMDNNPIMHNDPNGDIVPIVIAGIYFSAIEVGLIVGGSALAVYSITHQDEIANRINDVANSFLYTYSFERVAPGDLVAHRGKAETYGLRHNYRGKNWLNRQKRG